MSTKKVSDNPRWPINLPPEVRAEFDERIKALWPSGAENRTKSLSVERIMRWFFTQPVEWQQAVVQDRLDAISSAVDDVLPPDGNSTDQSNGESQQSSRKKRSA